MWEFFPKERGVGGGVTPFSILYINLPSNFWYAKTCFTKGKRWDMINLDGGWPSGENSHLGKASFKNNVFL